MASWKKDASGSWKKSESSKKNYTVVDGKKVEKTEAVATAPATSSDTWNKDTVTLEEAKQQTKDVEGGVINVDTGATSIKTPAQTEKISLEQAASQTETEQRAAAVQTPIEVSGTVKTTTEYDSTTGDFTVTKVTDTESTYSNLSTIKAGSNIRSAAQLDPIAVKKTETETKTSNLKDTPFGKLNSSRITADDLKQEDSTSIRELTTKENASLKSALLADQTLTAEDTLTNSTSTKSRELAQAYAQQDTDLYNASRLGAIEPAATKYESIVSSLIAAEAKALDKVNVLDKVAGKKINQPVADFVLSAGESLALTPVSTARMAVSAVRDPLGTARASVEQPVKAIIENPAKGLGSLAGSIVGGVALAKAAGVGGAKLQEAVKSSKAEVKANNIAKAVDPTNAPNYAENIAELKKFQKETDFTGDFFERVENPSFRVYDTKPGIRPQPDVITIERPSKPVIDKYAKKREWSKDDGLIDRKPVSHSKMVENELADALVQNEYFMKKNMQAFIEDERGSLHLDEISIQKSKPLRQSRDSIAGELKQSTVRDKINSFKSIESVEKQISSRGKSEIPSIKEQIQPKNKLKASSKPKFGIIPIIGSKHKQASNQVVGQNPIQYIKQDVLQIQRQNSFQKQTAKQAQKLRQSVAQAAAQKQTTSQQQEPPLKDAVESPYEPVRTSTKGPEFPRRLIVPPVEISPKKPRSSRKKGNKSSVKLDTIKNVYVDPMKALGRKKL